MLENGLSIADTIIVAVTSALGGYLGSYLKKGAEIQSVSDNLKELKYQQQQLTEATESVKHDIEHHVWRKKEQELIIRGKIEEFASLCLLLPEELTAEFLNCIDGPAKSFDQNRCQKIILIQRLYLPNFATEMEQIEKLYKLCIRTILEVKYNKQKGNQSFEFVQEKTEHAMKTIDHIKRISDTIIDKAANELKEITQD